MKNASDAVNMRNGGLKEVCLSMKVESVGSASNGLSLATEEVLSSGDVCYQELE